MVILKTFECILIISAFTFLFGTGGCSEKEVLRFELLGPGQTKIDFINEIIESDSVNMLEFTNIYNGAGVGIGDLNGDGRTDLFFGGNMVRSRIYLNRSEKNEIEFEDITMSSNIITDRWVTGVSIVDIDSDGLLDIYLCVSGDRDPLKRKNYLFVNQGSGMDDTPEFKELAEEFGIADDTYSTQSAFFDYDMDGDLDLFIATNYPENFYGSSMNKLVPVKPAYTEKSDRLYENMGVGDKGLLHFEDVSVRAGILYEGYSLGLVVSDINDDGWPDIYLSNDFLSNDVIYMNNGDGTFTNKIGDYFKHTTFAGMGCDVADFNNDGKLDIAVLDMVPDTNERQKTMLKSTDYEIYQIRRRLGYFLQFNRNTLQLNNGLKPNGDLSFSEIGQFANIHYTDWSWSILFGDLNNSGWKDLFITNGFKKDMQDLDAVNEIFNQVSLNNQESIRAMNDKILMAPEVYVKNRLFKNSGNLTFKDVSEEWGIELPSFSSGAAMADLDNDGDLELIISNLNDFPHIYNNHTIKENEVPHTSNYFKIKFPVWDRNRAFFGSKVYVYHGSKLQYNQFYPVRGYLSTSDQLMHFGLGEDTVVSKIEIVLPDQTCVEAWNIAGNQTYVLNIENVKKCEKRNSLKVEKNELFIDESKRLYPNFIHKEIDFNDFQYQPLILHKYSQMGPALAVGDVNGDKLDDFFVGGGFGQNGALYIQDLNGTFSCTSEIESKNYEDMGALFFDPDKDGDNDLCVVSGGVEYGNMKDRFLDRMYVNDGDGNFLLDRSALPDIITSGLSINAADIDGDSDLDLFIGGSIDLSNYPHPSESYLLLNESRSGQILFRDATAEIAPELSNIGMVSSSLWTDFNNDEKIDLIIVGEWMPVTFFENMGMELKNVTNEVSDLSTYGWWNSINGADFDKDGDIDYIVGNLGLNTKYKASEEEPICMYAADFDNNGRIDPIMFNYNDDKKVPLHSRDLIIEQINSWNGFFPTYHDFSSITFEDLDLEKIVAEVDFYRVNELRSIYLKNLGNNRFEKIALETGAQLAPVYGIVADDLNNDGQMDFFLSGNSYSPDFNNGPHDASIGYTFIGKYDGSFNILNGLVSGFFVDKDQKALASMAGNDGERYVLSSANNDSLKLFRLSNKVNKIVFLDSNDAYALIQYNNGLEEKREFYYSQGYLSASTRSLFATKNMISIKIYNYNNELIRQIDP